MMVNHITLQVFTGSWTEVTEFTFQKAAAKLHDLLYLSGYKTPKTIYSHERGLLFKSASPLARYNMVTALPFEED